MNKCVNSFSNILNNRKLCLGTRLIKNKYKIIEEDTVGAFNKNYNDGNECDPCVLFLFVAVFFT